MIKPSFCFNLNIVTFQIQSVQDITFLRALTLQPQRAVRKRGGAKSAGAAPTTQPALKHQQAEELVVLGVALKLRCDIMPFTCPVSRQLLRRYA